MLVPELSNTTGLLRGTNRGTARVPLTHIADGLQAGGLDGRGHVQDLLGCAPIHAAAVLRAPRVPAPGVARDSVTRGDWGCRRGWTGGKIPPEDRGLALLSLSGVRGSEKSGEGQAESGNAYHHSDC